MTPREAYIALNMIDKVGPVRVRALVERLGSPQAILKASVSALMEVKGVGAELAATIVRQRDEVDPSEEERKASQWDARIVTLADSEYPLPLRDIYDPPMALYVQGAWTERDRHALAVVGTRRASHYGLSTADRLAYQMAKVGYTVVSGLARGIDTAAHRGALKAGGRTIAVLGGALDQLYPPENAELARAIVSQGAVLSEFTLGRAPDRTTFPYRNRIVSGLSAGVMVVESSASGGAMQTADIALDQGRSVMAVPGRVDSNGARGPHKLIRNGARLVEDIDDVLREFEFLVAPGSLRKAGELDERPRVELMPDEQRVVRLLWEDALDVDTLAQRSGMEMAALNPLLFAMELKRIVKPLPGRVVDLAPGIREMVTP